MKEYIERFASKKFGIYNHFLFGQPGAPAYGDMSREEETREWKRRTEAFDPEMIAYELNKIGAGYYFITLMQGFRFMLAPNSTFDRLCGFVPGEACSERDIVAEFIPALDKYGIDLCLYFTGDGPYRDIGCNSSMGCIHENGKINPWFIQNWASVLEEYAVRYGDKIKAWWIDGCYDEKIWKGAGYTDELLSPYYDAVKKGNPNALVAVNNGVKSELYKWYSKSELTSGEQTSFTHLPPSKNVDGALSHFLIPFGSGEACGGWCQRGARISRELLRRYISHVNEIGGVVTVDIFIDDEGRLDGEQLELLADLMK
ncbi:MAG: alpha-L-fucosidase [Clostridia bacterium]|nr:alpha-L-fucosidase [Clostridia bacterium]